MAIVTQYYGPNAWVKRDYDERGRQIYCETSRGGWVIYKYDDQKNSLFIRNSSGQEEHIKYDENGEEVERYDNRWGWRIEMV